MSEATSNDYESVLAFWFGDLDATGCAPAENVKQWWKKDAAFDAHCRERFEGLHNAIMAGEREDWRSTPRGCLAYVIVLDQFSRNMFRGTPKMFASDARAQVAVCTGIDQGFDDELRLDERVFFYMPLMHAEDIGLQDRCISTFGGFCDELDGELKARVDKNLRYAHQHRDIVARFGRFPHRNELLGRESSAEEAEFLTQPGSSF